MSKQIQTTLRASASLRELFSLGKHRRFLIAALLILLLAAGLRFYRLDAQSFWNDEGNSARLSERTIPLILEGTASDIHPPLYYLMLRGWQELVGETEFGLRLLSAFLGVGLVALTMTFASQTFVLSVHVGDGRWQAKKQKSHNLAMLAGLLTAVNPALVYYSQEARMYELLAFLGILSTVLLIHWLRGATKLRSKTAVLYVLTLTAGLYTHYFFPAIIVTHTVMLLVVAQFGKLRYFGKERFDKSLYSFLRWLTLTAAAVFLYLPWLPIFIRQAGGRAGTRLPLGEFLGEAGQFLAFGQTVGAENVVPALVGLGLLVVVGLLPLGRRFSSFQQMAALGLAVPVGLMWLAGTTTPPFYKFMLATVPPLTLLAAYGFYRAAEFAQSSQHRALFFVAVSLLGLFLLGNYSSLHNMYFNPAYGRADYRGIAAQIEAEGYEDAAVILNAANQWEVFTYYYEDVEAVYPLPRGFPDAAEIEGELAEITDRYGRLYAIFWGEGERDPERLVERWLDANTFKSREEWVGDVRFVTYAVPDEPPGEMETAVNVSFGESITLLGYTIQPDPVGSGDIVQVALFWKTADPLDTRYKVFLHLIGADGRLWSQRDSEPGGNLALTTTWVPGEMVQDNHGLLVPVDAPTGQYTVLLGLYDIGDPDGRLPVETTSGKSDSFSIPILVTE